nr:MAG TPA: hypothetical protein [Bacteriophage sp.]
MPDFLWQHLQSDWKNNQRNVIHLRQDDNRERYYSNLLLRSLLGNVL